MTSSMLPTTKATTKSDEDAPRTEKRRATATRQTRRYTRPRRSRRPCPSASSAAKRASRRHNRSRADAATKSPHRHSPRPLQQHQLLHVVLPAPQAPTLLGHAPPAACPQRCRPWNRAVSMSLPVGCARNGGRNLARSDTRRKSRKMRTCIASPITTRHTTSRQAGSPGTARTRATPLPSPIPCLPAHGPGHL